ncbi:WD40-repeat-containing domain protein [Madurella fahalii]|uniref:WD40-repeat-containing domain protein n=1 Tax=Madurella fahalii TaxID=1157608 RepID=A0ABQ0GT67_9PEZI
MAGVWSTIKGAPGPAPERQSENPPRVAGASSSSSSRPSPPPKDLGTSSSRSLPRSHSSGVDPRGARSPGATTSQSFSPGKSSPSRRSRSSTALGQRERSRAKDRKIERENANEDVNDTTTIPGIGNGTGSGADVARAAPPPVQASAPFTIDPLSQHIFMRKNPSADQSIPQRLTQMAEGLARPPSDLTARNAAAAGDKRRTANDSAPTRSKPRTSFLSKLSMRGGRKKDFGDLDSDSEFGGETRIDGVNAHVFSQALGSPLVGGGFIPYHKEPPRYIRIKATNKRTREFSRMFLAQELVGTRPPRTEEDPAASTGRTPEVTVSVAGASDRRSTRTGGAIWATEFSNDGKYLASAGRDHVVRIWAVLSTPEERRAHEEDEAANGGTGERLSAPVFREQPVKEFEGHTGEILDLSWSKNNFLLSSSMDKTVRLWHLSRAECLCTFKHKDFVTKLAFHPRDDRFFLAGSLDTMLRLWSIPDRAVAFSAQLPDLVTAVAFSPDGKVAIAGLLNGLCMFYETEGLKLSSQLHVRSSRGKNAKGSKITGIQTMAIPQPSSSNMASSRAPSSNSTSRTSTDLAGQGEVRVLVTSNDSRIRIYNLRDKSLDVKFKGHENSCSQIAATFSDDGKYVICGSEDRKAFIWNLTGNEAVVHDKDKSPCESFEAHGEIVTTALFAPTKTRMLLSQSGDPIYDLCNPPPVLLQSLEEAASAAASQVALTNDSQTPVLAESLLKRPEPSPAYIARSTHYDGNIIVTTGDTGIIKVFRQDCAFAKRKNDGWETGSTFSRKLGAHGGGFINNGLGRSVSVLTRTSAGSTAHSRRGSLSQPIAPGMIGSPQLAAAGGHPERILSWRQDIENGGDKRTGALPNGSGTPARSERSISPAKASRTSLNSAANLAREARKQPYFGSSPARNRAGSAVTSPTVSVFSSPTDRRPSRLVKDKDRPQTGSGQSYKEEEPSFPPTPSFTFHPADDDDGDNGNQPQPDAAGGGSSFWNLNRWRGITGFKASSSNTALTGGRGRGGGGHSSLSRTRNQTDNSGDEGEVDGTTDKDRQQNPGVAPAMTGVAGDGKTSGAHGGGSDSDLRSVPAGAEHEGGGGGRPSVRVSHDGSPFRQLLSRLSSDMAGHARDEVDAGADGDGMPCRHCGGKEFKAKKRPGKQKLACGRCGKSAD